MWEDLKWFRKPTATNVHALDSNPAGSLSLDCFSAVTAALCLDLCRWGSYRVTHLGVCRGALQEPLCWTTLLAHQCRAATFEHCLAV